MALKNRKDMNPRFMWDLSHIFSTRADWETAYATAAEAVEQLGKIKGTLAASPESFKQGLDAIAAAAQKVELVYLYANLQKTGDNGDSEYQEMEGRAMNLYVAFSTASAFLNPELLAIPEAKLGEYIAAAPAYRHLVEDICRAREHTLDAQGERLLAMLGDAAQGPNNSFEMLESVDITFPDIIGENGESTAMTHGNFGVFRESRSQRVRRDAFEAYFGEFRKYINTFAAMYSASVKFDCYFSAVRNYPGACEAALFESCVPRSVYDNLISSVHAALPLMRRYLELRRRALGLETLNLYDLYCPIVEDVEVRLDYESAKELVKKALEPLGNKYQKLLDRAYNEGWIDVYENRGKTTGAFSCGVYGVHPYVLLNYTDTLDDAFTLAHELGHAMHSYLSAEANEYINSDYKILVAEVASTVNEVLLTKYLLKTETDPKRRAYIINHLLESFRTTVFRQTLFAEFELKAHEMYQNGQPLTAQSLSTLYHELNSLYYAGTENNEIMDTEWARIPHFYTAFYVYQYATGFSSAVAIAGRIADTGDASDYLHFLTTGGSDYPLEELKTAGVDLTEPATIESAMNVFKTCIEDMEKVLFQD